MDPHASVIHRGGESEIAIRKAAALVEEDRPAPKIESFDSHMFAPGGTDGHNDSVIFPRRILLNDNRVRTCRQNAAGEDPCGLPRTNAPAERMSGRNFAHHLQPRRNCRHIGGAHRVTIHGRHIGRGLRPQRLQINSQHATVGLGKWNGLRGQRFDIGEHAGKRLLNRYQSHGLLLDAVVPRLAAAFLQ